MTGGERYGILVSGKVCGGVVVIGTINTVVLVAVLMVVLVVVMVIGLSLMLIVGSEDSSKTIIKIKVATVAINRLALRAFSALCLCFNLLAP